MGVCWVSNELMGMDVCLCSILHLMGGSFWMALVLVVVSQRFYFVSGCCCLMYDGG